MRSDNAGFRDMALIRKLLIKIAHDPKLLLAQTRYQLYECSPAFEDYNPNTVAYQYRHMVDAGLFIGSNEFSPMVDHSGTLINVRLLSAKGHALLDQMMNDRNWSKLKAEAERPGVVLSIDFALERGKRLVMQAG